MVSIKEISFSARIPATTPSPSQSTENNVNPCHFHVHQRVKDSADRTSF